VAAWAVNQVAHSRPAEVRRLVEAAERLRAAQTGGAEDFASAAREERDAVRSLAAAAGEALREAGRPASDATLDKVAGTLHAAVADEEARTDLERGTLTRELEPAGFGGLLGAMTAAPAPKRAPKTADRSREKAKAREELSRTRTRARELAREVKAAERAADDAQRALERAQAEAQQAAEAVAEAERRLEDL
jgi:hypothetical protein